MENRESKSGIGVDTGDAFTDAVPLSLEKGKILRTTRFRPHKKCHPQVCLNQ